MKVSLTGKVRDIFSIASLALLCRARQVTSGSSPIYAKKEMTVYDGHFLFGASGDTAFFKKHSNINGFRTPEQ